MKIRLLSLLALPLAALAAEPAAYKKLTLSTEFFSEGAAFGDFNNDGKLDAVSGPYWYEGPDFTKRHELFAPIAFDPLKYSDNFIAFAHDFNADGWADVLVLGFPGVDASPKERRGGYVQASCERFIWPTPHPTPVGCALFPRSTET